MKDVLGFSIECQTNSRLQLVDMSTGATITFDLANGRLTERYSVVPASTLNNRNEVDDAHSVQAFADRARQAATILLNVNNAAR